MHVDSGKSGRVKSLRSPGSWDILSAKQAVLPRLLFQPVETARHLGPGSKIAGMGIRELLAKRKCQGKKHAFSTALQGIRGSGCWLPVSVLSIHGWINALRQSPEENHSPHLLIQC